MIWLLYALAAGLALIVAGGADDERTRRTEARAELARTLAAGRAPCPALLRDAHLPHAPATTLPYCPECDGVLTDHHICKEPTR